jgi:hypothetical protein
MMPNTIRTMRALALTLAAVAAVSACGGSSSGQPKTLPPVTTSPIAAATPSAAAAADVPAAAKAPTSAGAEAFAKFFYAQTNRAFNEKNPELVKALSAPGCGACDAYVGSIQRLLNNNERVEGYAVNVFFAVAPEVGGDTARVDVSWSVPLIKRFDAQGKVFRTEGPFSRVNEEVGLLRVGDRWLVHSIKSLGK